MAVVNFVKFPLPYLLDIVIICETPLRPQTFAKNDKIRNQGIEFVIVTEILKLRRAYFSFL